MEATRIVLPTRGWVAELIPQARDLGPRVHERLEALTDKVSVEVVPLDGARWLARGDEVAAAVVSAALGLGFEVIVRDASCSVSPVELGRFEAKSVCFTCGPGWFGWLTLEVGPDVDADDGVCFAVEGSVACQMRADASADGAHAIWSAVRDGVRRAALAGDPWGRPLWGARVTVVDAKYHEVDARPAAYGAGALAAVDLALRTLRLDGGGGPPPEGQPRPPLAPAHTKAWIATGWR